MTATEPVKKDDKADQSLIPAIKAEEDRLQQMLDDAKAEAARSIEEAEREAEARIEETKQGLPALMAKRREEALREIKAEVEAERETTETEGGGLAEQAQGNMAAAVAHILDRVWGKG